MASVYVSDSMVVLSMCRDGSGCLYAVIQTKRRATPEQKQDFRKGTASKEGKLYSLHSKSYFQAPGRVISVK